MCINCSAPLLRDSQDQVARHVIAACSVSLGNQNQESGGEK